MWFTIFVKDTVRQSEIPELGNPVIDDRGILYKTTAHCAKDYWR